MFRGLLYYKETLLKCKPDISKEQLNKTTDLYTVVLDSLEVDMMGIIRKWMKRNHFTKKTEIEYLSYIEEKTGYLYRMMLELFDDAFDEGYLIVDRDVLKKAMDGSVLDNINKRISVFFMKARMIAQEKEGLIKTIRSDIGEI